MKGLRGWGGTITYSSHQEEHNAQHVQQQKPELWQLQELLVQQWQEQILHQHHADTFSTDFEPRPQQISPSHHLYSHKPITKEKWSFHQSHVFIYASQKPKMLSNYLKGKEDCQQHKKEKETQSTPVTFI